MQHVANSKSAVLGNLNDNMWAPNSGEHTAAAPCQNFARKLISGSESLISLSALTTHVPHWSSRYPHRAVRHAALPRAAAGAIPAAYRAAACTGYDFEPLSKLGPPMQNPM